MERRNQDRWKLGVAIAVILLLILGTVLILCDNFKKSVYTVDEKESGYSLDMSYFNDTFSRQYELHQGDTIAVDYESKKGAARLAIGMEGQEKVYTGNLREVKTFTMEIQQDGVYQIDFNGYQAEGILTLEIIKGDEVDNKPEN